jgi:CHAT domain
MTSSPEAFNLRIYGRDPQVSAEWISPRGMRQLVSRPIEVDNLRLRTVDALVDLLRRNQLHRVDEMELLGEHMFVTLFGSSQEPQDPGGLLRMALRGEEAGEEEDSEAAGRRMMRVSLEIDSWNERLAAWPWEYLFVPRERDNSESGIFLGESAKLVLTRRLRLSDVQRPIVVRPPLRVLFAVLSPNDLDPIEYTAVLETLVGLSTADRSERIALRVFSQHHAPDGTEHPDPEGDVRTTYERFVEALDEFNPHVIHVIGHGKYGMLDSEGPYGLLAFPKVDWRTRWISDRVIANELQDRNLRLIFLQACETATTSSHPYHAISGLAQSLAQKNIPAVIAMHFQVNSRMASEFARAFYKPLMERKHIEVAMHAGRRKLHVGEVGDGVQRRGFGVPVLYLRESSPLLVAHAAPSTSVGSVGSVAAAPALRASEPSTGHEPRFEPPRVSEPTATGDERLEAHRGTERISGERNSA